MKSAIISKTKGDYWLATFNTDGSVTGTRVVGVVGKDKAGDVARFVAANFGVDKVGVKAKALGPACAAIYGDIVWLRPGFHSV